MAINRIRTVSLIAVLTAGAVIYLSPQKFPEQTLATCRAEVEGARAAAACTELLALDWIGPEETEYLLFRRSRAYQAADDPAARLADLEAALELAPGVVAYRNQRAEALYQLGQTDEGLAAAEAVAADHPDDPSALNMLAYLLRSEDRNDLALPLLERSRALPQNGHWAEKYYARSLADADRPEDAITVYVEALVENPEARWAVDDLRRLAKREAPLHTAAARSLLPHVREDPGRADLTEEFLMSCVGAGESCPALYPDRREARTEITCEAALTEWVERNPAAGEPAQDQDDPRSVADHIGEGGVSAYIVAASAYVGEAMAFIEDPAGEEGRDMILLDRMLHCTEGRFVPSLTALALEGLVFEDGNGFDDFFHPAVRANLLDVAWSQANPAPGD